VRLPFRLRFRVASEQLTIDIAGPYTFKVGDTRGLGQYKKGGWFHQVKMPKLFDFVRSRFLTGASMDGRC